MLVLLLLLNVNPCHYPPHHSPSHACMLQGLAGAAGMLLSLVTSRPLPSPLHDPSACCRASPELLASTKTLRPWARAYFAQQLADQSLADSHSSASFGAAADLARCADTCACSGSAHRLLWALLDADTALPALCVLCLSPCSCLVQGRQHGSIRVGDALVDGRSICALCCPMSRARSALHAEILCALPVCSNSAKVLVNDVLVPRPTLPAALIQLAPPDQATATAAAAGGGIGSGGALPEAQGLPSGFPAAAAGAPGAAAGQLALSDAADLGGLHAGLTGNAGADGQQHLTLSGGKDGQLDGKLALAFAATANAPGASVQQQQPVQAAASSAAPPVKGRALGQQAGSAAGSSYADLSDSAAYTSLSSVLANLRAGKEAYFAPVGPDNAGELPAYLEQQLQQQGHAPAAPGQIRRRSLLAGGSARSGTPAALPQQGEEGAVRELSTSFTPEQARASLGSRMLQ